MHQTMWVVVFIVVVAATSGCDKRSDERAVESDESQPAEVDPTSQAEVALLAVFDEAHELVVMLSLVSDAYSAKQRMQQIVNQQERLRNVVRRLDAYDVDELAEARSKHAGRQEELERKLATEVTRLQRDPELAGMLGSSLDIPAMR